MNLVSFIIRTKNEAESIERTLKAIRNQKEIDDVEIVLVDSGSTDETVKIAQKYTNKIVYILPDDFTWGYALNEGIKISSGNYICLISGHCTLIHNDSLKNGLDILQSKNIKALYGIQKGEVEKNKYEVVELIQAYPNLDYYEFGINEIENMKTEVISNACCLFERNIWNEISFDENIQSAEDSLWAKKICKQGYRFAYTNQFGVFHGHKCNYSYIYTKNYWRRYCGLKIQDKYGDIIVLNFIKHLLIKPVINMYKYGKILKNKHILFQYKKLFAYHLLIELAIFNAISDRRRKKIQNITYEQLIIPENIKKLGEVI